MKNGLENAEKSLPVLGKIVFVIGNQTSAEKAQSISMTATKVDQITGLSSTVLSG